MFDMPWLNYKIPVTKRFLDLLITCLALILLSPLIILITAIVWIFIGSPVIYSQVRPGLKGKPFTLLKFRSMNADTDHDGNLLPDGERLTKLGKFLRAASLDELPELINVLKGEMSLVGPRPLLMQYLDRYSPEQARRHAVLPGLTGWAQINGRNTITWNDKFLLDVWYVDHWSFWLDIKILLLTVWKVITREGINQPGHATAEEFLGNEGK